MAAATHTRQLCNSPREQAPPLHGMLRHGAQRSCVRARTGLVGYSQCAGGTAGSPLPSSSAREPLKSSSVRHCPRVPSLPPSSSQRSHAYLLRDSGGLPPRYRGPISRLADSPCSPRFSRSSSPRVPHARGDGPSSCRRGRQCAIPFPGRGALMRVVGVTPAKQNGKPTIARRYITSWGLGKLHEEPDLREPSDPAEG